EEVTAAQRDIAVVAADLGLRAGGNGVAFDIAAEFHCRLAPAFTTRLQFDQRICEREQRRRAGEQLALEIGAKAVAENGDGKLIGYLAQLEHRALREELRLVDQDAVETALLQFLANRREQVDAFVVHVRR